MNGDLPLSRHATFPDEPATAVLRLRPLGALQQVLRGEREPDSDAEARAALTELGRRRSGRMPAELLVERALLASEGTDWPTRRATLEALLRRLTFAARDGLAIAERPADGAVLGRYALASGAEAGGKKQRGGRRPYRTEVYGLSPLDVSCDCADFLRSSLGLCKHALVVLEALATSPRHWSAGSAEQRQPGHAPPQLRWDWLRPWTGEGDRLAGLRWQRASEGARAGKRGARPPARRAIERGFEGERPAAAVLDEPEQRLAWLEALQEALAQGMSAEPAALAVVRDELASARRRAAGRAASKPALAQLRTLKRKLYPYQLEGVSRLLAEQRLLLADDMGLGKTTQAIAACHALFASGRVSRGLLIVPAPLKPQWHREWQATTDRVPLEIVEGQQPERARLYRQTKSGFLVMHYEQLLRDLELVQRFAPEIVVLDEAQRIKNWATKSHAYVTSLQPEWRLVLTGTPLENRLEELAALLDWIDDAALAPKWRLSPWHTTWSATGERVGARHLDTLRQRSGHCLLRRVRREVLQQLPPRTDARVPIEMTEQQREEHDARTVPIAQLMRTAQRRPLRPPEFLKLMQLLAQQRIISNGLAQLRFDEVWPVYSQAVADETLLSTAGSPKLLEVRRLISDLALTQGRKVVVFSQWRKMLRLAHWAVQDLLEAQGLRAVFFTGEESQRTRSQNVVDFDEDASVRVMFLSDAGGVGLNLQRAASAVINLELPWNPAVLEQRVGRIYRLGQTQPIDVFNLVTEYGIESRIAGLIGNKEALFSGLFDGTTDSVRFDTPSSFVKDLERLVEHVQLPPGADLESAAEGPEADDAAEDAGDDAQRTAEPFASPEVSAAAARERGPQPELPPAAPGAEATALPAAARSAPPSRVEGLFERLRVTRTEDGGLRVEAEPEVADELARLLQGLAALLRSPSAKG